MPRRCTVCAHAKRAEIDKALVSGNGSYRDIARRYKVTKDAIERHRSAHLPAALTKAQEAKEVAHGDDLLQQVRDLQVEALEILNEARGAGALDTALKAIGQARRNLELLGKLAGELESGTTVNVIVSPQWVELRTVIINALAPHPEARRDVVAAIEANDV